MASCAFEARTSIVIVDDFEPFRSQLKILLNCRPKYLLVGEASNGTGAVRLAANLLPDIILLDVGLPGMHGMEAARRISECSPASRIIFVTEDSCSVVAESALKGYGSGYVVKTDIRRELLNAIDRVLEGKKYVSKRFAGCCWAEQLNTLPRNNTSLEVPLLVHANAVLASTREEVSMYHQVRVSQECLVQEAGKKEER